MQCGNVPLHLTQYAVERDVGQNVIQVPVLTRSFCVSGLATHRWSPEVCSTAGVGVPPSHSWSDRFGSLFSSTQRLTDTRPRPQPHAMTSHNFRYSCPTLLLLQVLMAVPNIIATYWPGVHNVSSPRNSTTPPGFLLLVILKCLLFCVLYKSVWVDFWCIFII